MLIHLYARGMPTSAVSEILAHYEARTIDMVVDTTTSLVFGLGWDDRHDIAPVVIGEQDCHVVGHFELGLVRAANRYELL